MKTANVFGNIYVYCTKLELPEVIERISDYTIVFVVTAVNDLSDMLTDIRKQFGINEDTIGKFIVLRRAGFIMDAAQEMLEQVSDELFSNLVNRASNSLPLMPFRPRANMAVRPRLHGKGIPDTD